MKHRLFALLDGMEMTRSEHDWLEQRFDNMTTKEELLFRGAVGIEHPKAVQDAIQILQSLEHFRLLYGADDDVTLGRFVMEHIHSPTPAARAYTRLPINKIGAFAEYVAVDQKEIAKMPKGYDFATAAAIPLTGLTAYQAITEELEATPGQTLLIPGGSGSFGQMAVPIAKALGLRVVVTGNARAKEQFLATGVDRYLDYKTENYWDVLSDVDHVIDTLGPAEFEHELAVPKKGGRLVSLRTGPNKAFAKRKQFPGLKKLLFSLAGSKYDKTAKKQGKEYRFVFVRSDGAQLRKITEIV